MRLMVLGASRHKDEDSLLGEVTRSQCTWWCWVLPDPRRVVRCPAWGNGARIATGPKAPLGPGRTFLIEPGFAQFSQGLPPMGLQGVRAARMSTRPYGSGAVLCSSDAGAQARAMSRQALARRPSAAGAGGGGRRPRTGRPSHSPSARRRRSCRSAPGGRGRWGWSAAIAPACGTGW